MPSRAASRAGPKRARGRAGLSTPAGTASPPAAAATCIVAVPASSARATATRATTAAGHAVRTTSSAGTRRGVSSMSSPEAPALTPTAPNRRQHTTRRRAAVSADRRRAPASAAPSIALMSQEASPLRRAGAASPALPASSGEGTVAADARASHTKACRSAIGSAVLHNAARTVAMSVAAPCEAAASSNRPSSSRMAR